MKKILEALYCFSVGAIVYRLAEDAAYGWITTNLGLSPLIAGVLATAPAAAVGKKFMKGI